MPTVSIPELMQLLRQKSTILYLPPNSSPGFAMFAVRHFNLLPCPPTSSIAIHSFLFTNTPPTLCYQLHMSNHPDIICIIPDTSVTCEIPCVGYIIQCHFSPS